MNAAMRVATPPIWTTGSTEAIKTGTWRAALPHHVNAPSPCHQACPVHGDIAAWIGQARARDFRGAWDTLMRQNPFPAIAGRVCHHPCESACNRMSFDDEAVSICKLERLVGDMALEQRWLPAPPAVERREHVAVVGAGPSGLSAAYQLRRLGYRVTVYEARPEAGGVMRYGIPSYRLARDVLDGEIGRITALGVELRCGIDVNTPERLAELRREHDAVYLALGAGSPKRLAQLPVGAPWWLDGADYLAQMQTRTPPALGPRLAVIGGGSAAMDVARSARRAGHAVTIVALESKAQMPAQPEELREALEEGIALADGTLIERIEVGAALTLHGCRVRFEPGRERGSFTLTREPDGAVTLEADAVVSAIGQDPQLAAVDASFARDGALLAVDARGATSAERVWAGGDLTSMARFVTEAAGMGRRAAIAIHQALSGEAPPANAAAERGVVGLGRIATWYHPAQPRAAAHERTVEARLADGAEVQLGLELDAALAETERCFSCGTCIYCDNCFHLCPDLAIRRVNVDGQGGYEVLTDYCKGCGLCVKECPTGSMLMEEEQK